MRRVVITGMGVISPVGSNLDTFWGNITAGRHGIAPIENLDMTDQKASLACQVRDFNPDDYIDKKESRRMDPSSRFAVAAAKLALEDCGTDFSDLDPYRIGVLIGSGIGGLQTLEENHTKFVTKGPNRVSPLMIPVMVSNIAGAYVSMAHHFKGINYCTVSACSSSGHAVGEAMHSIRDGYSDVVVAGGTEATITPFAISAFANMMALCLATDPDRASIPFDAERSGFVMGEGAGVLVLEEYEHAKARGAKIYAEVAGYAATGDAYHITSPDPDGGGAFKAMEFALKDAGLTPGEIGYINAHGTSTPPGDKCETSAVKNLFGAYAKTLPMSSTKSMTGHLLGAAGAVESIICALTLQNGVIPPTANYKVPDPECDLDYVTDGARKADITAAISNSFGFGGHNTTLCFKKI
jgi:3-oxoacyl-[acyl-carrier-protein] synthase II